MNKELDYLAIEKGVSKTKMIENIVRDWFELHPVGRARSEDKNERRVHLNIDYGLYCKLDAKADAECASVPAILRALIKRKLIAEREKK